MRLPRESEHYVPVAGLLAEPLKAIDQALLVVWRDHPDLERLDAHYPGREASEQTHEQRQIVAAAGGREAIATPHPQPSELPR